MIRIFAAGNGPPDSVLETEMLIPANVSEVFDFFADAMNLESITPPWLRMRVTTPGPIEIRKGTLIDYRLGIHHLPLRWRSEISVWEPPFRFVDRQLRGPYSRWEHTHDFEPDAEGTIVRDHVVFRVPGGWPVRTWFVQPRLLRIFQYRQERLAQIFAHDINAPLVSESQEYSP